MANPIQRLPVSRFFNVFLHLTGLLDKSHFYNGKISYFIDSGPIKIENK